MITREQQREIDAFESRLVGMNAAQLTEEQNKMKFQLERKRTEYQRYGDRQDSLHKETGMLKTQLKETNDEYKWLVKKRREVTQELNLLEAEMAKLDSAFRRIDENARRNTFTMQQQIDEALRAARVFTSDIEFRQERETKQVRTGKMFRAYELQKTGTLIVRRGEPGTATVWASYDHQHPTLCSEVNQKHDAEMRLRWARYQHERIERSDAILQHRKEVCRA